MVASMHVEENNALQAAAASHRTPCRWQSCKISHEQRQSRKASARPAISCSLFGELYRARSGLFAVSHGPRGLTSSAARGSSSPDGCARAQPWNGWPRSRSSTPSCRSWAAHILHITHITPVSVQTPPPHIVQNFVEARQLTLSQH